MALVYNSRLPESPAKQDGVVAQLGERRVRNAKVEGSIPFHSTRLYRLKGNAPWSRVLPSHDCVNCHASVFPQRHGPEPTLNHSPRRGRRQSRDPETLPMLGAVASAARTRGIQLDLLEIGDWPV